MSKRKFFRGVTRFRLMLTLGLAVLLPAAALIVINFFQLRSFDRNKVLEATIHRDFQEMLAISEKTIDKQAITMIEEARENFPSPDANQQEKEKMLDAVLATNPWITHAFLFDGEAHDSFVIRTQPSQNDDEYVRNEHDRIAESFHGWFGMESKSLITMMHKRTHSVLFSTDQTKRADGPAF